ncbi:MAG: CoA-binding protein [Bacillota bacterium]
MSQDESAKILREAKVIAVVGLSNDPLKDSFQVGFYLKQHGYRIIPVNPLVDKVLGEKSYKTLLDIPIELQKNIDVVDIFRKTQDVPPIVEQAIQLRVKFGKPSMIWMQLGIVNEVAAEAARKAGLIVVMDKCLMVEHKR